METKHTPGPWQIKRLHSATAVEAAGDSRVVTLFDHQEYNGKPCGYNQDKTQDEIDANARLIAAAPELLEALEELEDCAIGLEADVDSGRDTERNAQDVRYACKNAREAIAKATGKGDYAGGDWQE